MSEIDNSKALLSLTAEIVSAHVRNNAVETGTLPSLIEQVFAALRDVGQPAPAASPRSQPAARPEPERQAPAVPPKKSVFPDYIVCLEDGRKLKTLKRHLRSTYSMTPEQYREKWDLPAEYPMVAPNYAEHRSALAKKLGLGRKPAARPDAASKPDIAAAPESASIAAPPPETLPPAPVRPTPPVHEEPAEAGRYGRTEHTAASVFSKFPNQVEPAVELPGSPETDARKSRRKPFSKQLARTMRP
jgi:predicted transcriptional regulator